MAIGQPSSIILTMAEPAIRSAETESASPIATAPPWDRVDFAPPDAWVEEERYDRSLPAREGAHLTHLLWALQSNAEAGRSFHAIATRLETPMAVQNQSQWRLNLDPRFQKLTIHWLRVTRGDGYVDQLKRDRMRLIQRETQLEHHIINGSWTLLVVLDDVRPGDVIDAAYTYESTHPLNAGWCEMFFAVPPQQVVGRFHASVLFHPARPGMAFTGSGDAPARVEKVDGSGRIRWVWEGSQPAPRDLEPNQPGSHLDYLWIQASDVPGWDAVSRRVAEHWAAVGQRLELDRWPAFRRPPRVDAAAVTELVRNIQDEFRYLSVDLATGGWIPMEPAAVARQRRGDCKDLVWLAVAILRSWGVDARPMLVASGFRKALASFLPTTGVLNHALVEVEVAGWRRWFDLTARFQGGDFREQAVGLFGFGLPVDAAAKGLREQPNPTMPHIFALRETILLDTGPGGASAVERRLWVNGYHADNLRRKRMAQGAEEFANDRLRQAEHRFGKVRRVGAPQWRDDREKNVCELVETFEVTDAVVIKGKLATYDLPRNAIVETLPLPPDKPRRTPWLLPFPLELRHLVVVKGRTLGNRGWRRRKWTSPDVLATIRESRPSGEWSKSLRMIIHSPEIPAERTSAYRALLFDFLKAATWRFYLPAKRARPGLGSDFGILPAPGAGVESCVATEDPSLFEEAVLGEEPKPHWRDRLAPLLNRRFGSVLIIWGLLMLAVSLISTCTNSNR